MVASSLKSHGVRTVENRFGVLPSCWGFASENTAGLNIRFPGSLGFKGLNVSGLNTLVNPPAGGVKSAHTAGPFQKFGWVREFGCPSGTPLRWRMVAEMFQPPTSAFSNP